MFDKRIGNSFDEKLKEMKGSSTILESLSALNEEESLCENRPQFAIWVKKDGEWKIYGGSNSREIDRDAFLKLYDDVKVVNNGEDPESIEENLKESVIPELVSEFASQYGLTKEEAKKKLSHLTKEEQQKKLDLLKGVRKNNAKTEIETESLKEDTSSAFKKVNIKLPGNWVIAKYKNKYALLSTEEFEKASKDPDKWFNEWFIDLFPTIKSLVFAFKKEPYYKHIFKDFNIEESLKEDYEEEKVVVHELPPDNGYDDDYWNWLLDDSYLWGKSGDSKKDNGLVILSDRGNIYANYTQFSNDEITSDEYDSIQQALTELTGKEYKEFSKNGYSQGDVFICYYPVGEFSEEYLDVLGCSALGMVDIYEVQDTEKYPDTEIGDTIFIPHIKNYLLHPEIGIADKLGVKPEQVVIKKPRQTYVYESLKEKYWPNEVEHLNKEQFIETLVKDYGFPQEVAEKISNQLDDKQIYVGTEDHQGGRFGVGREETELDWAITALEWGDSDEMYADEDEDFFLEVFKSGELIDWIQEIWDITIVPKEEVSEEDWGYINSIHKSYYGESCKTKKAKKSLKESYNEEYWVVAGYDKDNDYYENFEQFFDKKEALTYAEEIEEDIKHDRIKGKIDNEPFDWLVIDHYDKDDNLLDYESFYDGKVQDKYDYKGTLQSPKSISRDEIEEITDESLKENLNNFFSREESEDYECDSEEELEDYVVSWEPWNPTIKYWYDEDKGVGHITWEASSYTEVTPEKEESLDKDITVRELLDMWWNSVRVSGDDIEDEILLYKDSKDGSYELDEEHNPYGEKILDMVVHTNDEWSEDADGYPIIYAELADNADMKSQKSEEENIEESVENKKYYVYMDSPYASAELIGSADSKEEAETIKAKKDAEWKPGYLWNTYISDKEIKETNLGWD